MLVEQLSFITRPTLYLMNLHNITHFRLITLSYNSGPHLPLSNSRYIRLNEIAPDLLYTIHNNSDLVVALESKKAITKADCEELKLDFLVNHRKNAYLVDAILRRSNFAFDCFEEALILTRQSHVANLLKEG